MALTINDPNAQQNKNVGGQQAAQNNAMTALQVQQANELANSLLKEGLNSSPTYSPWGAVGRIASSLVGALQQRQAAQGQKAADTTAAEAAFPPTSTPDMSTGGSQSFSNLYTGNPDHSTIAQAIANIESSDNYNNVTDSKTKLGYALGRYQVMEGELPAQLAKAGLPSMTPQQFLADHGAQDKVFEANFFKYPSLDDNASAWLTGQPLANAGSRHDRFGTNAKIYVDKLHNQLDKLGYSPNQSSALALQAPGGNQQSNNPLGGPQNAPVQVAQNGQQPQTNAAAYPQGFGPPIINPQLLPKMPQYDPEALKRMYIYGTPEQKTRAMELYKESQQPGSYETPNGTLLYSRSNPSLQRFLPKTQTGNVAGVPAGINYGPGGETSLNLPQINQGGGQAAPRAPGNQMPPTPTTQTGQQPGASQPPAPPGSPQRRADLERMATSAPGAMPNFPTGSPGVNDLKAYEANQNSYSASEPQYRDDFKRIQTEGRDATNALKNNQMLLKIMQDPRFVSGTGADVAGKISDIGRQMGLSSGAIATLQQAAAKLTGQQLNSLISGAGYASMADTVRNQSPDPLHTPEANIFAAEAFNRILQQKVDIRDMALAYAKAHNGRLDRGFDSVVQSYQDKYPTYDEKFINNAPNEITQPAHEGTGGLTGAISTPQQPRHFKYDPKSGKLE